jgi:hypothetical protein
MAYGNLSPYALVVVAALLSLFGTECRAQEQRQDHSCTADAAGAFAFPKGDDGHNFNTGWGLQAGGGFAVWRSQRPTGFRVYITANFMYEKFAATAAALRVAKMNNPALANATSAHGGFPAVTLDPTVRYALKRQFDVYGSGGFGWLRRGIGFNGVNPQTLIGSNGPSLDRLASNSGVFDLGGGINFRFIRSGLMLFAEVRVYRGVAINSASTLVPISAGIRW